MVEWQNKRGFCASGEGGHICMKERIPSGGGRRSDRKNKEQK